MSRKNEQDASHLVGAIDETVGGSGRRQNRVARSYRHSFAAYNGVQRALKHYHDLFGICVNVPGQPGVWGNGHFSDFEGMTALFSAHHVANFQTWAWSLSGVVVLFLNYGHGSS
jgi:hypothetical protein